ncbi:MAG: 6-bladed beta-propeller [Rikenellaceae bacterium]|jgi:hypothetical protein|nr:6-bladed beta-propeller [Rikenellaceae bacterium]
MKTLSNMIRNTVSLFAIVCLFVGCFSNRNGEQESLFTEVTVDDKGADRQATEFFEQIDSVFVLDLQTADRFLLGSIERVRWVDEKIYVLDNTDALYVYDRQGNPLFQVGRQGRGPGEYIGIRDFYVTAQHILLFDDSNSNLIVYDKEGVFQYNWETDAYDIGLIDDRTLVEHDGAGTLTVKNLKGEVLREFTLDFHGLESVDAPCFSSWDGQLSFTDLINQCVYRVSPDTLTPSVHLNLGSWQIPSNYYHSFGGEAPNNTYMNVYQKTSFETNFGLLRGYEEGSSWEYYPFTVKMMPKKVYRHKASGRTLLLESPLTDKNIDPGFLILGVSGGTSAGDFFVTSVEPEKVLDFLETDPIKNPMLLRLRERIQGMNISPEGNPLLLFYRLKNDF